MRGVAAAECNEHKRSQSFEAGAEVREETKRSSVGPVTVVDGEQHWRAAGEVRGQPVQAVQARELLLLPRLGVAFSGQRENRPCEFRRALHERLVAF